MGSELNIYKIAQEAGVSPATVSRVMTKNARVSEEKRARVEAVIRKYDYRPNALAQGLIKTKTNVIGVLAADLVNPYYSSMVENCEKEIIARGYVPMICGTLSNPDLEVEYIQKMFDMRMDAIIVIGGKSDSLVTEPEYADLINRVAESIPVITTGKVEGGECCQVTIDEAEGMNQSMECLIGLGHRRIALIGGVEEMKSTYDKRIRYRSLLRKNGLTYRERYVIKSNYSIEGGYQGFEALFQGNKTLPTAVIAINDYSAVGVMRSIKEHGLRIPEDNYAQWTNHGFIYRLDWAKEAGLTDGVKSWEDLTTYFKYVKEAYPDVIPWDSDGTQYAQMANGWITSHSNFVAIDGVCSGALWGGTKDDLYTITTPAYTDTDMMVEYAKLMKEWDNIGVWKTDVLNNTASSNRDDYRIGRVAAEQHHTQTWTDLCSATPSNTIYQDDPDAESGFFYFGEETGNVVALSITHGAMAVSAASKNPERALMVYDLLRNDEECYRLLCYGIEGVSYEINDEGLRTTPEGYNSDTDNINGMTNWWWGRNDDLEIRDATRNWDAIDKLYSEYDSLKIDYPYGQFVPEVDDIQSKIDNINEVYTNYTKQISYGKYQGTAEEIVAEMQSALKQAGIEEVTAALQEQFDALYK